MKLDTVLSRIKAAKSSLRCAAKYTRDWKRTFMDHAKIVREIIRPEGSTPLPRWAVEFLAGYSESIIDQIWDSEVIYSYYMNGHQLAIDSEEYKKIPYHTDEGKQILRTGGMYIWRGTVKKWA